MPLWIYCIHFIILELVCYIELSKTFMFEANTIIQEHIIHLIGLLIQNLIISEMTIHFPI